ncbi:hypothetical protein [Afipia clevelandensis]|uniref:Uncharacterized protein n=1 Tax=Afipia clevelandensis ATCC 49720 TaxID=883079 RepID=K8PQ22_9BRAD|nr:hypothetical protein [Afipia clevelandensis]EKS40453.1 hypothetical protein HMPREF9696_00904 [Afipia clevelandensis ATCC 49720]
MRDVVSETQVIRSVRATSAQAEDRMHILAVYGAFALIAAIVFGTLSFHPF